MPISLPQWTWRPSDRVDGLYSAASPNAPQLHRFDTSEGRHLLIVDRSRIYTVGAQLAATIDRLAESVGSDAIDGILEDLGLSSDPPAIKDLPPAAPALRALSLAIAQKCNLGCTYCYASQGDFGGAPRNMSLETATAAVDMLISGAAAGDCVNLAFLGGEPLLNRRVLRATTEYAHGAARRKGVRATFSLTTNGTLLTLEDAELFERFGFSVTISIDGIGDDHDRLRPFKNGRGSFDTIMKRVRPLLAIQRAMQVSARVTVTPRNLCLRKALDDLIDVGFHSVGFSPVLNSSTGQDEMRSDQLAVMLDQLADCGDEFVRRVSVGRRYPFLNLVNALKEIHRGTHRPYPCGAGAGYMGISADGELVACHRFVSDDAGAMGTLTDGIDRGKQARWLSDRHVNFQQPCRACWARYLCGGGCHHEVIHRGRGACDFIRGWLHYCLQTYVRILAVRPDYFSASG